MHGDRVLRNALTRDLAAHVVAETLADLRQRPKRVIADWFLDHQWGIASGVVIADGCKTGIGKWQRAIRDCLQDDITYIGTSTVIGWYEATVFCSAFYGALVRNRGLGRTPAEQGWDAANRAIRAYETLTDQRCPYKPVLLTPSRQALRSLTG